jgi:photosystem II stability/assembly factor-like uncharacterized protein
VASSPMRNDSAGTGIFSLAFAGLRNGVAVGGDYKQPQESARNIATTADGGKTWIAPAGTPPGGFRSAVEYLADRKMWIAAGPSGSDISLDDGRNWRQFDTAAYNALSFVSGQAGWAVGPNGAIAKFSFAPGQP